MEQLRDGMFRLWRVNITKGLFKYLNRTYSAWRSKLKGIWKIRWDEVSRMYIWEVNVQNIIQKLLEGSKRNRVMSQLEISSAELCIVHGGYGRRFIAVSFGGVQKSLGMR